MNCSEIQELLSAYYDGELAENQRASFSDHLAACSDCSEEVTRFEKLAAMASALDMPVPPEQIWTQIEQQLDQPNDKRPVAETRDQLQRWVLPAPRLFALVAIVLIAVGIGWFISESKLEHGHHQQFAAEFDHYLKEFRRDPGAAQRLLLARVDHQVVGPDQAIERVGYRPAVAEGLPEGYLHESTRVLKMPCCTCVQSICKRSDGSTLAIFEHDDDSCDEKHCCLIKLDDQIVASWKRGTRHITLIGVRDIAEANAIGKWMDGKSRSVPN